MLITTPDNIELEIIPGHSIYANEVQGTSQGVYLLWEHLTDAQRQKFQEVNAELAQVTAKLQCLFTTEFAGRDDACRG